MSWLSRNLALTLMVIGSLSLGAVRPSPAAACHSTCAQELAECKRTCTSAGPTRRECRRACAERTTCTAPGARIRTLAYVVTECSTNPQGQTLLNQKLVVRRGNCDPVPVMEVAASAPVADPEQSCRSLGNFRNGEYALGPPHSSLFAGLGGVFHRIAVVPDGSGVVFEVTTRFSSLIDASELPRGDGTFFVRADGTDLQRITDASRFPTMVPDGCAAGLFTGYRFSVSPNGRKIAFIDYGKDIAGNEAPQIFLLDVRTRQRTQLTHVPEFPDTQAPGMRFAMFFDDRTVTFFTGTSAIYCDTVLEGYRVKTHGSGMGIPEQIGLPVPIEGAQVIPQFGVAGAHAEVVPVIFSDLTSELMLVDGKQLLELTKLRWFDTALGRNFVLRGRAFFTSSANPDNRTVPHCQMFSVGLFGGHVRQLTQFDGDPGICNDLAPCTIHHWSLAGDDVTGTVLFASSCDPFGRNPFGGQIFAMRPDGSGLRQLTATRGMTEDADGTLHVEVAGPFGYPGATY